MGARQIELQRQIERAKYEKIYSQRFIPGTKREYTMAPYRQEDYARYLKTLEDHKFESLLDVGCGKFVTKKIALERGYKTVVGADIARNVCDVVGAVLVDGAHCLPFPNDSFDVVTCIDTMEHVIEEDVPSVVEEMCRVAKHRVYMMISHREGRGPIKERGHITVYPRSWWLMVIRENMPPMAQTVVHNDDHIRRVKMPLTLAEIILP